MRVLSLLFYENGWGNLSFPSLKGPKRANRKNHGCEKVKKIYSTNYKRDAASKLGM